MNDEQHRDVEKLAYFIWEREGRPDYRALEHWLEAETIILTGPWMIETDLPSALPTGIY